MSSYFVEYCPKHQMEYLTTEAAEPYADCPGHVADAARRQMTRADMIAAHNAWAARERRRDALNTILMAVIALVFIGGMLGIIGGMMYYNRQMDEAAGRIEHAN